jgi:hypothetical protein
VAVAEEVDRVAELVVAEEAAAAALEEEAVEERDNFHLSKESSSTKILKHVTAEENEIQKTT